MGEYYFLFLALYASIGVMLWLKLTSAFFCILSGGAWSKAASKVSAEFKDELSEAMDGLGDSLHELDNEINGRGLPQLVGMMALSVFVVIAISIQLVKFVVAWPIVFRSGILRRINKLTSKK